MWTIVCYSGFCSEGQADFSGHFPHECTSTKTKAEWTIAAHAHAPKWLMRDTLPLFSQAQVLNLIGHLCYLILQPLRVDRERVMKNKRRQHNSRYIRVTWLLTSMEMLWSLSQHKASHMVVCSSHISLTNTSRQTLLSKEMTQKKTPKNADVIHSPRVRLILPHGRSYVEQMPSAENSLWEL